MLRYWVGWGGVGIIPTLSLATPHDLGSILVVDRWWQLFKWWSESEFDSVHARLCLAVPLASECCFEGSTGFFALKTKLRAIAEKEKGVKTPNADICKQN